MSTARLRGTNADIGKRKDSAAAENRHVALVHPQLGRLMKMIGICLIVVSLGACRHPAKEPVTLTFLDPEWAHDLTERNVLPDERLQEFTRQTGIRVKHLPAPESALDQLGMARELLGEGASGPDVLGIDVIWPGTLSQDLIDLKPYFATELSSVDPDVVASYTVKGKLVAMPFHADIGVLFYRSDLLREYGYGAPPRTWDQLEKMATRIQQGERAKGQRDFWGFVWPGAAGEGLTCNALEWQVAEGGGRVIETDNTISVNNPNAVRTWQRAAHWIGWISSPNVISYEEWDAVNAFYLGKAAFFRGWARSYFMSVEAEANPAIRDTAKIGSRWIGITSVLGGKSTQAATLGGFGLGVSRSAVHPAEALELVRFLIHKEIQAEVVGSHSEPPKQPELYEGPVILKVYPARIAQRPQGSGVVSRPSAIAGQRYEDVDHAYIRAVHSVLTGKTRAPEAAAGLEKELVEITGFKTGPPSRIRGPKD
ncbi:MAG TPA: extracellular solute-binding protein [Candidatus Polarisedimenticolia bacterium]|nr:extracellular solute-binding protein [Candidatus Polarisedimenticolia bacterium]